MRYANSSSLLPRQRKYIFSLLFLNTKILATSNTSYYNLG
jgi:hypothetical protein